MTRITLKALHYEPERASYREIDDLAAASVRLGRTVGCLVARHAGECQGPLIVCSTTVSDLFYDRRDLNTGFRDAVRSMCGREVEQLVSTYECASWGYALRYCATLSDAHDVTLVVMDANVPHFEFWERDQVWGRSGHGILVASLSLARGFAADLEVGCDAHGRALLAFARALQRRSADQEQAPIFAPFLTPQMEPVIRHLPIQRRLAPNLYATRGHCFGSDPWIGLLGACQAGKAPGEAVVGSFALNGYFCVANILIDARMLAESSR